ncbi:hypothetical protein PanWU01x14_177730 [Parasponia andersonii]|uniref:Uncharacterized protein n=1 Tax=Parasponia andersonii TaxID=3476 RepID=A0A2P5C796_PARAD|nr:hypothetical protein PanWU01x14_177730 [Parasponia andersonii]
MTRLGQIGPSESPSLLRLPPSSSLFLLIFASLIARCSLTHTSFPKGEATFSRGLPFGTFIKGSRKEEPYFALEFRKEVGGFGDFKKKRRINIAMLEILQHITKANNLNAIMMNKE